VQPIDFRNVSDWKAGGYQDWLSHRDRLSATKEMASYAADLAKRNGGNLSAGAAAIASGRVLELIEAAVENGSDFETVKGLVESITALRNADGGAAKLDIDRQKLEQKAQEIELHRAKFQRDTCELFVKWSADERAKSILDQPGDNSEKIQQLGKIMFGEEWGEKAAA
jgi:hypothetical protein